MFVKIESWHIAEDSEDETLCGRPIPDDAQLSDSFGDEKSCESCLRIKIAREESDG